MQKLPTLGVLEQALSPWAANTVFVGMKDCRTRLTSAFMPLNAATVTDTCPMKYVRNKLDWLGAKKVFSTFNLKHSFFQVELDDSSKLLTAIRSMLRILRYTRMPMGMTISPVTFQIVSKQSWVVAKARTCWPSWMKWASGQSMKIVF